MLAANLTNALPTLWAGEKHVCEQYRRLDDSIAAFVADRDWNQFHTPKNLAMALAGEVGELVEIFQWLTAEESAAVIANHRSLNRPANGGHSSL